jgi:hypothetical protein
MYYISCQGNSGRNQMQEAISPETSAKKPDGPGIDEVYAMQGYGAQYFNTPRKERYI